MSVADENDTASACVRELDDLLDLRNRAGLEVNFGSGVKGARPGVVGVVGDWEAGGA